MKKVIGLLVIVLLVGCGKNGSEASKAEAYLNKETVVVNSRKSEIILDSCEALRGEALCYCIDRNAFKECDRYNVYADNGKKYDDCITPYINRAYGNYCEINKAMVYRDQR